MWMDSRPSSQYWRQPLANARRARAAARRGRARRVGVPGRIAARDLVPAGARRLWRLRAAARGRAAFAPRRDCAARGVARRAHRELGGGARCGAAGKGRHAHVRGADARIERRESDVRARRPCRARAHRRRHERPRGPHRPWANRSRRARRRARRIGGRSRRDRVAADAGAVPLTQCARRTLRREPADARAAIR